MIIQNPYKTTAASHSLLMTLLCGHQHTREVKPLEIYKMLWTSLKAGVEGGGWNWMVKSQIFSSFPEVEILTMKITLFSFLMTLCGQLTKQNFLVSTSAIHCLSKTTLTLSQIKHQGELMFWRYWHMTEPTKNFNEAVQKLHQANHWVRKYSLHISSQKSNGAPADDWK